MSPLDPQAEADRLPEVWDQLRQRLLRSRELSRANLARQAERREARWEFMEMIADILEAQHPRR